MDTSQTLFFLTQGFDPNMAYTSIDITSFDQTQMTPATTYDQSLEYYILLIKRLQNKLDKETKKVQYQMESSIK